MIEVINLASGVSLFFGDDLGPEKALICAYAQSIGDNNTWDYESMGYAELIDRRSQISISLGDFAVYRRTYTPEEIVKYIREYVRK